MPTFALVFWRDTRTNTGSAAGKVAVTLTSCTAPLTEIRAEAACPAGCLVGGGGGGGGGVVTGADGGAGGAVAIGAPACCTKGSFVAKRSNESSCPVPACGAGSESVSVPEPVTAAATGVPVAGATAAGVVGAGAAAAGGVAGGFLFIVFKSEGTSYARTPRSKTPRTAAMIFWRLAFALASNFFAITAPPLRLRSWRAAYRATAVQWSSSASSSSAQWS